jgi:two-component system, OmpR family, response regulator
MRLKNRTVLYEIPQMRKSMKVLVIDDNHDITEVLSFYFEHENIDYELINNGKEGLKAIREHNFDLILLDMAMPGFSGIEVIRSLKKNGIFESRNIVIFTASSDPKIREELGASGAKMIFKKPCSLDDLKALIEKYRRNT